MPKGGLEKLVKENCDKVETDLVNKSWCMWSMRIKSPPKLLQHQISVEQWGYFMEFFFFICSTFGGNPDDSWPQRLLRVIVSEFFTVHSVVHNWSKSDRVQFLFIFLLEVWQYMYCLSVSIEMNGCTLCPRLCNLNDLKIMAAWKA